jgi:Sec-independent protein translocase protein TatA
VGAELLLGIALGFVVLGPKRMYAVLGHVFRVKAEIEKAHRNLKSQLGAELGSKSTESPSLPK